MRDVVIVNYNTQRLTECAIRSLNIHTPGCCVTVFDNSDREPFSSTFPNVSVIDNTHGDVIDFRRLIESHEDRVPTDNSNYGSACHCRSVDVCFDLFPDGFLLMDSDVLVRKDVSTFFDDGYAWCGWPEPHPSRFGVTLTRVLPFICYLNVPMLRRHGIRYYNDSKMFALTQRRPDVGYDTGCWFFEECERHRLQPKLIRIYDHITHLGHGSWTDADADGWLNDNRGLWQEA